MNIEAKIFFVFVIVFLIMMFGIPTMSYIDDKTEFSRQVKCKEIGGIYTYENNRFICK